MKKIYTLPQADKIQCEQEDVLTISLFVDTEKRESVVRDPFAPQATTIAMGHQEKD